MATAASIGAMNMDAGHIDSVESARLWAVEHDARVNMLWENQLTANKKNTADHEMIIERLASLERKLVYATGFIAAVVTIATVLSK